MAGIKRIYQAAFDSAKQVTDQEYPGNRAAKVLGERFEKYSNAVLKGHLEPHLYPKYELLQGDPMAQSAVYKWRRAILSHLKPKTRAIKDLWNLKLTFDLPIEVFQIIKIYLKNFSTNVTLKETKWTCTIEIRDEEDLRRFLMFGRRPQWTQEAKYEDGEDILIRDLGSDGHCKLLCSNRKKFQIKMSHSRRCVTLTCSYGHWNGNGVPQHH